jgi:chromosome segregation ATPase
MIELNPTEFVVLFLAMAATIGILAWALRNSNRGNSEIVKTLLVMNDELRESIKERHASEKERADLREQASQSKSENNLLKAELIQVRQEQRNQREDNERVSTQVTNELVKMKGVLKQAQDKIAAHERENERLTARVGALEDEGRAKDKNLAVLKIALDQSEKDKRELADELKTMQEKINGKVDKPITEEFTVEAGETKAPDQPEIEKAETPKGNEHG